jgi:cell division protein FtsN
LAQDDYFYEIQLTNKQLVFYFMAGATGLILSFLAGVMVGRGVDQGAAEVQAARPLQEERIVTEEPPRAAPSPQELTYAQRLEAEGAVERLERPKPSPPAASRPTPAPRAAATPPVRTASTATTAPPVTAAARPAAGGGFALQVGAFKDRATAESMVARLKGDGFAAYLVTPQAGLFNVRVGTFGTRPEAEVEQAKLRARKFDPFVVKQ